MQICQQQSPLPSPVQQALLIALAKELAAKAVQFGAVKAGDGPLQVLAGAVVYLSCNVVLLQPRLTKNQHWLPIMGTLASQVSCPSRLDL